QNAAQVMGHNGGWPLNCFLTPKGVPFFAVGFLPREERLGQPAFKKVLTDLAALYRERPDQVAQNSNAILQQMESNNNREMRGPVESITLDMAALRVGQRFDIFMGGLIGPMKFPQATLMEVLWRAFLRSGAQQFLQLFTTTLDNALTAGLYDHIGGGFFRYTNDERWQFPHFEKMLFDSAQMIDLLTGVWQFNRNELCRQRVAETVDWMLREMKLGDAFAAGLDADSEGEEGKYYLWSEAEVDAALAGTFSARFKQVYGVTRDGSVMGKNILRRNVQIAGLTDADEALLAKQRGLLLAARGKRVRPQREDKILTDWNGLAIRALAQAGVVFERPDWVQAAAAAYDYVRKVSGEGETLYHSWADNQRGEPGFSDDYAQMARAALQLWEVTGEQRFLDDAKAWTGMLNSQFWNEAQGGYNYVRDGADPLIIRLRMIYDPPTPSTNGTMITVLTRLALITGSGEYGGRAQALIGAFAAEINRNFIACGELLNGFEYFASGLQIVVMGARGNARTQELIHAVWGKALPNRLLVVVESGQALPEGHPARGQEMQNGQPTAYICQRNACSSPITSAVTLSQTLTLPPQRGN
ncbi:MAG TPA: thioredoxin domain-containing protein, partial [Rhizomicrobium sp.]|nr:thioredoxin domain-containing protein [Rhizomicrobium sp.]